MSGRKVGEVMTVLAHAAETRKALFDRHLKVIRNELDRLTDMPEADGAEVRRFLDEAAAIEVEVGRLGREMQRVYERVRKRARSDDLIEREWYFDEEYDQAANIDRSYRVLQRERLQTLEQHIAERIQALEAERLARERASRRLAEAEAALSGIEGRLASFRLNNPLKSEQELDLQQFCREHWGKAGEWEQIDQALRAAREAIDAGDGDAAASTLEGLSETVESLMGAASDAHETMVRMVSTAREVRDVLEEMGYRVGSSLMGDTLADGLKVETVRTDHPVAFEFGLDAEAETGKDDDGTRKVSMAFNLDQMSGNCHDNVVQLMGRLRRAGIGMEMTDWGSTPKPVRTAREERQRKREEGV